MREIQTGLDKPEGGTKQRLTKSADNSAPVCFPNCASICLGSRVSFVTCRSPYQSRPQLFRPLIPSSARGIDGGPRRFTEVVLNEQSLPVAYSYRGYE